MKKISIPRLREMKAAGEAITMITAYSAWQARLVEEAGAEMILVGDSLAMVEKGHSATLPVTMDVMVDACAAVTRSASIPFIVGDMPFLSYEVDRAQAIANAGRFIKEAAVDAVKLEGGLERSETIRAIVGAGMAVVGHIGLTPQSTTLLGGFRVQGRDVEGGRRLLADARAVEEAGACALVLECVPAPLARLVSESLAIPTIGIGAGAGCDGQVLVFHDILGLYGDFRPRFVKRYVEGGKILREGLAAFVHDVRRGTFPDDDHAFGLDEAVLRELKEP